MASSHEESDHRRQRRDETAERHIRELEREVERLESRIEEVGHDLRNHLAIAAGRLELAREERDDEHLEAVARSQARMEELLEDLFD
jgi:signal transduction histidine kinase